MFQKLLLFIFSAQIVLVSALADVQSVNVKTLAPNNKSVDIYYRVPANYNPLSKQLYRVLVIFGGRNCAGRIEADGAYGFGQWADENGVFLIGPGFKDDKYWEPEKWSGKALFDGLKLIKKKYNICDKKIMYYGWSGGSQASNLFPAWKPEACTAWVSHACGVFHSPSRKMMNCPGLITCGDADIGRYIISRHFVSEYRKLGLNVLWKSYPNLPHEVPKESSDLARMFLNYYHEQNIGDLQTGLQSSLAKTNKPLYIGDDQEDKFWPADSRIARNIDPDDRVELYTRELALAWGKEAKPK